MSFGGSGREKKGENENRSKKRIELAMRKVSAKVFSEET